MPHYTMMTPQALAKLSADMGFYVRVPAVPPGGDDDFPSRSHEAREFKKRHALLEAQNHRCGYCGIAVHEKPDQHGKKRRHDRERATIDEIVPRIAGGKCTWSNQIIACRLCNEGRGAMRAERYFEAVQRLGRIAARRWGAEQQRHAQLKLNRQVGNNVAIPVLY